MFCEFEANPTLPTDEIKYDMLIEGSETGAENKPINMKVQHPLQPTVGAPINDGGWEWA